MANSADIPPVWVTEFDVCNRRESVVAPTAAADGRPYARARILVRCLTEPIGVLTVPLIDNSTAGSSGSVDVEHLVEVAHRQFGAAIASITASGSSRESPGHELSPSLLATKDHPELPGISVVIGSRNRPERVVDCVNLVLKQDYPGPFEIIVVDNGAADSTTADAVRGNFGHEPRVHYIHEARPGLSRARNIGLQAARHERCAFLSDDIRVEPWWLLTVARGFLRSSDIKAVAGWCAPLYLESDAQIHFEGLLAWGSRQGFTPQLVGFESSEDRLHPYRPGAYSNGSNIAFDTEVFRHLGGFDERLGPGTRCRGGEDLDAPVQLLFAGHRIAYEPAMFGWHADLQDERPLSHQLFSYGMGLSSFLAKHLLDARTRPVFLRRVPHGVGEMLDRGTVIDQTLCDGLSLGWRNRVAHMAGRLAGPAAFVAGLTSDEPQPIAGQLQAD